MGDAVEDELLDPPWFTDLLHWMRLGGLEPTQENVVSTNWDSNPPDDWQEAMPASFWSLPAK